MPNQTTTFYADRAGKHRWSVTNDRNGKIIGASTEGYSRKIDAERNLQAVADAAIEHFYDRIILAEAAKKAPKRRR